METRQQRRRLRRRRRTTWIAVVAAAAVIAVGLGLSAVWAVWSPNAFPTVAVAPSASASHHDRPPQRPKPPKPPKPAPTHTPSDTPDAPAPVPPPPVPSPADRPCDSPVTMAVVAHYDDDLIFANPHIQHAMAAGNCVRTVFLTAGDAGRGLEYARSRELGILRAYNVLRGVKNTWSETPVTLASGVAVSQWSPDDNPKISVTFLRLPDGGVKGQGFDATGRQTLAALNAGTLPSMTSIDRGQSVTRPALLASISELIGAYHATELITLTPQASADSVGDHSDHSTTGTMVREAWQAIGFDRGSVLYALGYPGHHLPSNVTGSDLELKLKAFKIYAAQDSVSACKTDAECLKLNTFGSSLQRQYLRTDVELFGP